MSLHLRPHGPRQSEDELGLDRVPPSAWDTPDRDLVRPDDVRPEERRVVVAGPPAPRIGGPLDALGRGIGLVVKLTVLAILVVILFGLVSLVGAGVRAPGALGEQVGAALQQGAGVVAAVGQRVADTFDPAHPPRAALPQDVEIDELQRLEVGAEVVGATTRTVTVASIQRRPGAESPDAAVYAVLHSELRVPDETRVLGVTVRSSRDPKDHYLYKGETIRIGRKLYKVNWVSVERQQVALVAYREQDRVTAPLKAEID